MKIVLTAREVEKIFPLLASLMPGVDRSPSEQSAQPIKNGSGGL